MRHSPKSVTKSVHRGFTIVELLVSIAIIGLLMSIALPAIMKTRASARKVQCLNRIRNLGLALTQFEVDRRRLPASGNFHDPEGGPVSRHHSWAVSILPYIEFGDLARSIDLQKPIDDPVNQQLHKTNVPVFTCPDDLSLTGRGDLSFAVNGGIGYTRKTASGVRDCPADRRNFSLDLNGDGNACSGTKADNLDRDLFKKMGLFFLENWNQEGTVRHHALADVRDGTSHTLMVAENVRTGSLPDDPGTSFATPDPFRSAFVIGNPCKGSCSWGNVDYSRCNTASSQINSGIFAAEGASPTPSSFHTGGVHACYADGHASFLSQSIDGEIYAALASPVGTDLEGTSLRQRVPTE